jgi:MoaA/NifB/PqqE/SkfB family radical SAM enzyme
MRGRVPGQLIIQITDACNAQCPQCEMRVTNRYRRSHLERESISRALAAAAERGVVAVSFTGGEPFLDFDALIGMLEEAGSAGIPLIRTGTNGYFLRHPNHPDFRGKVEAMAERLAATQVRNVWFSVDSANPAVHERMRGLPGVFEGMEKALPIFEEYGIWPTANLGINRNTGGETLRMAEGGGKAAREDFYGQCLEAFEGFYAKVLEMGFTIVNFCYPMSVESEPQEGLEAVYRASSADDVVHFRREEKVVLFAAMSEAVARYRHRIRIFSPRNMLYSLVRQYETGEAHGYACRGGIDFFFMSALDGDTYPCGFRADESLGKFWELEEDKIDREGQCTRCDWECFRDPSNLAGPFLEFSSGLGGPFRALNRMRGDRDWARLWREDLRYQRVCDYCDGRVAPDYTRLARFAPGEAVQRLRRPAAAI